MIIDYKKACFEMKDDFKEPNLPWYFSLAGRRRVEVIPFPKELSLSGMQ